MTHNNKRATSNEQRETNITIITVVLNGEKYITQTIESVISQKQEGLEYIVIDGGSTDGTLSIIEKYKKSIDKVISETDKGLFDAMNKGVKLSSGKWIWFLNSDDYLADDIIKQVFYYEWKKEFENSDLIYGNIIKKGRDYSYTVKERNFDLNRGVITFNHQASIIKREAFNLLNGFNIRYFIAADYDFFLKFSLKKKSVLYLDKDFATMRQGGVSEKLSFLFKGIRERFKIDSENVGFNYAVKNLFLYNLPGAIKKNIRFILEKLNLNYFLKRYFNKKYNYDK